MGYLDNDVTLDVWRMKGDRRIHQVKLLEKRKMILAALTSAVEDIPYHDNNDYESVHLDGEYYSLTQEEVEALVTGDVEKIRSWVSNLDKRHAAWLLHQLIDESW
jgi:hypothetical protein